MPKGEDLVLAEFNTVKAGKWAVCNFIRKEY